MEANPHCFVCNSRLGVSTRNAVQIFSEQTNLDRPVITVLSSVLSLDVKPSAAHSKLLCKKCLRSINEFEEHETRLAELRIEIISDYNRTAVKYNKPPIPLEHEMEILEDDNSAEEFVEETKSHQIEPKNQVDSYKAEDCSAPIKQPECDADVSDESQLARMHQQQKPTDPKTQQLKVMTTPQLVKINTIDNNLLDMKHTTQSIGLPAREQANLQSISDPLIIKSDHTSYQNDEDSVSSQMEDDVESIEYSRSDCEVELSEQQLEENTTALLEAAAMAEQRNEAQDSDIVINIKVEPDVDGLNRRLSTFRKRKPIRKIKEEPDLLLPLVARAGNNYACLLCHNSEEGTPKGDLSLQEMLDAKDITAHMKTAHDQRLYICDICGADFRKRNEMSEHLEEHVATEEGDFQCETCNRIFSNLRLFRIHRRMHYPQNKLWPCDTCGKKYSSRNLLDEHVNTHTGNRPYQCHHCAKDFASKYTMAAHLKTHTMRPRPHSCTMCGKSFFSTQNLAQHERTHSGIKNYICNTCGKGFGTPHNLEVHNIVHTGYKPFICRTCGKAFARRAEIRDHERTHTGERPYSCDLCGSQFSQRSNLQSHKRATHYDDKRHKCEMCGKCFKRRRLLDYHIKATHTGERPFKCDVCASTFVYPEHFKKHQRIHSGEKPYLCEVCGKAFNSRDNRNAHRFVHSDKKPYECLVCGQGFMRKPLLYAHMQSQGHLNDTIVVNQPRFQPDDEQVMTLETLTEERSLNANDRDSKLYLTELKEHIIIQTAGDEDIYEEEDNDRGDSDENMTEEHLIIDGPVNFSDEQDFGEENTIITLEDGGDDFSEQYLQVITDDLEADQIEIVSDERRTIETSEGPIQLVQIRIPGVNGKDNRAWVNIVQSSKA